MLLTLIASLASGVGPAVWPPDLDAIGGGLPPEAQVSAAYAATSDPRVVVVFFSVFGPDGPRWFARRVEARTDAVEATSWASAEDCPALYAALDWLSDLQPPAIAANGLRRLPDEAQGHDFRPRRGPVADGPTYWLFGSGWGPDQSSVHVSLKTSGGYLADWAQATESALASCWTKASPIE